MFLVQVVAVMRTLQPQMLMKRELTLTVFFDCAVNWMHSCMQLLVVWRGWIASSWFIQRTADRDLTLWLSTELAVVSVRSRSTKVSRHGQNLDLGLGLLSDTVHNKRIQHVLVSSAWKSLDGYCWVQRVKMWGICVQMGTVQPLESQAKNTTMGLLMCRLPK